jgi:hypothetical protein
MSNLFTRFKKLLPQQPLRVGTVLTVDNGVATIQEPNGATAQARGDVSVGDHVYFQAGAIQGSAPDLPTSEITVTI